MVNSIKHIQTLTALSAKKEAYIKAVGHPFERKITHIDYPVKMAKGGWSRVLSKNITDDSFVTRKIEDVNSEYTLQYLDHNYLKRSVSQTILPVWGGGSFLILLLGLMVSFFPFENNISTAFIIWFIFLFSGFSFFAYYYITMPYKECIFNRQQGLVTIPGAFWQPNITMSIHTIEFIRSAPSAQGIGSHMLQVIRPMKGQLLSFYDLFLGGTCYEDLSFYLWYMDKNRPLPPGTAFDPYRDKDFERRKAEGFPRPLFHCNFITPEHTPEQQAERRAIAGW